METVSKLFLAGAVVCVLAVFSGCEDKPITISYDRPAEYQIPSKIHRIAVAEFGGATIEDKKYGNIAADLLAARLHADSEEYNRYELVDRKRLRGILDEQDLQLAISDSAGAVQAGKIANVQAMIYGSVNVSSRDERASKMGFDFASRRPITVHYTKRYCMVSVNFTMDDISTSQTLAAATLTREYDSDKGSKASAIGKAIGFVGNGQPPADQIITHLIEECVEEFVGKVSPHSVTETVKMETGKCNIVRTGNKLARAGEYDEAMECYERALKTNPDDDGTFFNIGLIYEAKGNLAAAEAHYAKAFALSDKEKYVLARQRVKQQTGQ